MMKRLISHRWIWWQLRLRTLMLVVLACGIGLSGVSYVLSRMRERQRIAEILGRLKPFDPRLAEERDGHDGVNSMPSDYWSDPFLQRWYQHFRRPYGKTDCSFVGVENSRVGDRDLTLIRPWHDDSPITGINLANTQITDAGVRALKVHTSLTFLNLDQTQLTDCGLEQLNSLKRLRLLSVRKTQVTEEGVAQLQKALPNCWVQHDGLVIAD